MKNKIRTLCMFMVFLMALSVTFVTVLAKEDEDPTMKTVTSSNAIVESAEDSVIYDSDLVIDEKSNETSSGDNQELTLPVLQSDLVLDNVLVSNTNTSEIALESGNFTYQISDGGVSITKYNGSEKKVTIPSVIDGKSVIAIGQRAFAGNNMITEIMIPDAVTKLGEGSFYAGGVFRNCTSLKKITFGKGITRIPTSLAFGCYNLEEVTFKGDLLSIGENTFYNCSKLVVTQFPKTLESIGARAFFRCINMNDLTIPDKTTIISSGAFTYCERLENLNFGKGLTTIGEQAFGDCYKLKEVSLPESLVFIENQDVFARCTSLSKVVIPDTTKSIAFNIFKGSPKTTIYGSRGSYAQTFASQYAIPFKEKDTPSVAILQSIAITHSANKLNYQVGETLDISGLEVTGTYSDGTKAAVTVTDANITGFDSSEPATDQVVTVTVEGKTATFVVNITAIEDAEIAKVVSEQIAELPGLSEITLGYKADVISARIAYDDLSPGQKTLVTNLDTLAALETKLAELELLTPPVKDEETGIEALGLPSGVTITVEKENENVEKVKEAQQAAKEAGIVEEKVISLNQITPNMTEAELNAFNNDPESFVTLNIPLKADQLAFKNYKIYHQKNDGSVEWITPTVSADGKILIFKVSAFSSFGVLVKAEVVEKQFDLIHKTDPTNLNYSFTQLIDSPSVLDFIKTHYTEYLFVGEDSKRYEFSQVVMAYDANPEKNMLDILKELEPVLSKN